MSPVRPLVVAGLALALGSSAAAHATKVEVAPAQRFCAPERFVTLPCADVRTGAGVVASTDATSGDARPVSATCTWRPNVHQGQAEWVLRIDAAAPGATRVAGTCHFTLDGSVVAVSSSIFADATSYGELYVPRTAAGPAVAVRCLQSVTAEYADGTVKTRTENCPLD